MAADRTAFGSLQQCRERKTHLWSLPASPHFSNWSGSIEGFISASDLHGESHPTVFFLFIRLSFSDNGKAIKPSPALRLAGLFHPLLSKPRFLWIKMLLSSFASLLRHSQHSPSIPRLLSLRRNPPIPYACLCFLDKSRLYGMNRLGALTTTGPVFQASRLLCRASSPSG